MTIEEEISDIICIGHSHPATSPCSVARANSSMVLALIRERVDKIRKDNPYDIEFWKVDAETLMVTHRTTGFSVTDRERQNAYVVFDEACHEVLRILDK